MEEGIVPTNGMAPIQEQLVGFLLEEVVYKTGEYFYDGKIRNYGTAQSN